jgi:hypothetical protein
MQGHRHQGPLKETHSFNPASAWAILVSRRRFRVTNDCHTLFLRPEEVSRRRGLNFELTRYAPENEASRVPWPHRKGPVAQGRPS